MAISIKKPRAHGTAWQPRFLRRTLQALRKIRWRVENRTASVTLSLQEWSLTPALVSELAGLPTYDGLQAELTFDDCEWPRDCNAEQLASVVPACYNRWDLWAGSHSPRSTLDTEKLVKVCSGAVARGQGAEKLTLRVYYKGTDFEDTQRSHVEASIDQAGGSGVVEVEWRQWD